MKFSPRRQEEEMQRSQFSGRGMGESMPNQIADELGRTITGVATEGPGYFNAEGYEFQDAENAKQKLLRERKRQAELDRLLGTVTPEFISQFTPPGGYMGAPTR
jgi:hypothetical protein